MFAALDSENLPIVIKAFKEAKVAVGTEIIKEGEEVINDQPALYVFESGKCSCFKKSAGDAPVFTYTTSGQYFGELALLYNAPRAATEYADEESVLWSIDRDTFNYLVKDAARLANERRKAFLDDVPILQGLSAEQKATIADVLQVRLVMKDEVIIKEGEVGKDFFILESGALEARKGDTAVKTYAPKEYFGELALLRDAPRAASVVATGDVNKVLSLDQASFKRIVGSLEEVMKQNAGAYEGVDLSTFK
jgi:cAMP-dependent protein kinase regulator